MTHFDGIAGAPSSSPAGPPVSARTSCGPSPPTTPAWPSSAASRRRATPWWRKLAPKALFVRCDLLDLAAMRAAFETIKAQLGPASVLVNMPPTTSGTISRT